MGMQVCNGATLTCSFGAAPSTLVVPSSPLTVAGAPAATVMNNAPNTNIPPFGMCSSPSNPQVISATAAANGVLTPMPCVPATPAPWAPGSPAVTIGVMTALNNSSTLTCTMGGVITIGSPGQTALQEP
jgi:hypothetical protein